MPYHGPWCVQISPVGWDVYGPKAHLLMGGPCRVVAEAEAVPSEGRSVGLPHRNIARLGAGGEDAHGTTHWTRTAGDHPLHRGG